MQRFRRRVVAGCAAALALATAGCWPQVGQGPDRTGHNAFETRITVDTVDTLAPAWTSRVTGNDGAVVTSPNTIVLAAGFRLWALESGTGAVRWSVDAQPLQSWYRPVLDGDGVEAAQGIFGATTSRFDEQTGVLLGTRPGLLESRRSDRTLFREVTQDSSGRVTQFLRVDQGDPPDSWGIATSVGSVSDGGSWMSLGAERVYVSARGLIEDNFTYGNGLRVYDRHLPSFCGPGRPPASCPVWAISLPGSRSTPPVIGPGEHVLYVGTNDGTIVAVDAASGARLWAANVGSPIDAPPALADGTLFVAPQSGQVYAFAAGGCGAPTCAPVWRLDTAGPVVGQPAVAGGLVFVGATDGTVIATPAVGCGAPICTGVWQYELGSRLTVAPIVSQGQLIVGSFAGGLVSFRPAGP